MKTYDIYELHGEAWCEAVYDIAHRVNMELGTHFFPERDGARLEDLAHRLHVRFNEDGSVVNERR